LEFSEDLFNEIDFYKNIEFDCKYIITKVIPNVIRIFNDGIKCEHEKDRGTDFILCIKNKVYLVDSAYAVAEFVSGFCSVGSGRQYAYGSLKSTENNKISIPERIKLALECAEENATGVQRPFTILNTKDEEIIKIM
jgi:ATP-dependent protease HslVU (ClpYQ) peptidase subunit